MTSNKLDQWKDPQIGKCKMIMINKKKSQIQIAQIQEVKY